MVLRPGWMLALGMTLAPAPGFGQAPTKPPAANPAGQTGTTKQATAEQVTAGQRPARTSVARLGVPRTLTEALAATYTSQPALLAARAKLRATDENVPQALAGWRPTVVMAGSAGYGDGFSRIYSGDGIFVNTQTTRLIGAAQATLSQPIYTGGKTQANINRAKNQVMAERATLIAQEQSSFTNAVNAYVGVIQAQQLLALNVNNEQVLAKQLQATNERYRYGEVTRTDVAQAEAALAGATAQRQTAEGNLQTARGTFEQVVGFKPPGDLVEPQPLSLPVKNELEARAVALVNNPLVVAASYNDAAAKDTIDVAFAQLLPQVSLQGQVSQSNNTAIRSVQVNGYQAVVQLSVPIYQGGSEYATVRQSRQLAQQTTAQVYDARRTATQNAVQAWQALAAARASAESTRQQIRANEVALVGVEREATVGSRTTLDVLNAQQALLTSRVALVQNLAQLVNASYSVAAAIGRLTARDLHLPVPLYDETAYYNAVKNKWVGLGDYATSQPGR